MIRYDIDNYLSDSIIFLGTKVSIYVITKNYSLQPMHKVFLFLMKTKKRMLLSFYLWRFTVEPGGSDDITSLRPRYRRRMWSDAPQIASFFFAREPT